MKKIDPLFWVGLAIFAGVIGVIAVLIYEPTAATAQQQQRRELLPLAINGLMGLGLGVRQWHRHRQQQGQRQPGVDLPASAPIRTRGASPYHSHVYVQVRWQRQGKIQPVTVAIPMADMQRLYHRCGNKQQAERLVRRAIHQVPGQPGRWYVDRVLADLPRSRPAGRPRRAASPPTQAAAAAPGVPAQAIAQLMTYTHCSQAAERLLHQLADRHPGRSWDWLVSKGIYDITRDRQ